MSKLDKLSTPRSCVDADDRHPTVVIADDNPGILKVLAELLQPRFSVVAQARNGHEALRAVERLRPRLAIFDVGMPKLNGFEVARKLIESQSSTKIVFFTLLSGKEFIDEARRCGNGYVAKTRAYSDLLPALEAALRGEFFTRDFAELRRD